MVTGSSPRDGDPAGGPRVRKNMDMDASKLRSAGRVLGTRTDTETVDRALDYVLFQDEVFGALDRLSAAGGVDDIDEPRRSPGKVAEGRRKR